jgi:hypothetical protein
VTSRLCKGTRCRVELRRSDVGVAEQDLPVEIRAIHDVIVTQPEFEDARASKRERRGTT